MDAPPISVWLFHPVLRVKTASICVLCYVVGRTLFNQQMNRFAIGLLALGTLSGSTSFAHNYEGGITADPITIQNQSTDVLGNPFDYAEGTPSVKPLNVTLGPGEETNWHQHNVPLWVYVTEGSFVVDYGSKGKKTFSKGMSYLEPMNWCHKGINGTKQSKAIIVYMGQVGIEDHTDCKRQ